MSYVRSRVNALVDNIEQVIFGKHDVVLQCVVAYWRAATCSSRTFPG